jgi:hypothetical protein
MNPMDRFRDVSQENALPAPSDSIFGRPFIIKNCKPQENTVSHKIVERLFLRGKRLLLSIIAVGRT